MARSSAAEIAATRARRALARPQNWIQLLKFSAVGLSGFAVNLAVYSVLLRRVGLHYLPAAICSFAVAVANNYLWNRLWTFRETRGDLYHQGARFLVVSLLALGLNLGILRLLVEFGTNKIVAQAIAIILVTPFSFSVNKLWSFRRRP
ncbi:MAG: GtrA family protein [Gaiellaceae bacterium]